MARKRRRPLPVIVCLPESDGGWVDLLEAGAFQVLAQPCTREKVQGVINDVAQFRKHSAA
jgi:DNA-binding NtrC family response regulator